VVFFVLGIAGATVLAMGALIICLVAVDAKHRLYALLGIALFGVGALSATVKHMAEASVLNASAKGQLPAMLEKTSASFALALVSGSLALLLFSLALMRASKEA